MTGFTRRSRLMAIAVLLVVPQFGSQRPVLAQSAPSDATLQIAAAVQAAPVAGRAEARVYGFHSDGTMVTLREGSNEFICLADNPVRPAWEVACYHSSIEAYMARGRELRSQGITDAATVTEMRWKEAEAGTLAMPTAPATLYVLAGDGFDAESETVTNPYLRWVIYSPWATPESTGLSASPQVPGSPWLMFPGTPGAHVMISPPTGN